VVPALPDLGTSTDGSFSDLPADSSLGNLPADLGGSGSGGDGSGPVTPSKPIADVDGKRGGALAAVAGLGLLAMLITAEADRRKMRRAQREIPLEA
jgi:hypothetical protein